MISARVHTKYIVPAGKYTLETGRMVNLGIKEHQCQAKTRHAISIIRHNIETGHQILFDKTITIAVLYIILSKKV